MHFACHCSPICPPIVPVTVPPSPLSLIDSLHALFTLQPTPLLQLRCSSSLWFPLLLPSRHSSDAHSKSYRAPQLPRVSIDQELAPYPVGTRPASKKPTARTTATTATMVVVSKMGRNNEGNVMRGRRWRSFATTYIPSSSLNYLSLFVVAKHMAARNVLIKG
jgi:hypothetical protein